MEQNKAKALLHYLQQDLCLNKKVIKEMSESKFNPLEIVKAQFSNKSAEKCRDMKISTMIILIIGLIFITAFPYINQRTGSCVQNAEASRYPGFGAALIKAAEENSFYVKDGILVSAESEKVIEEGEWTLVFTPLESDDYLKTHLQIKDGSYIIFSEKTITVSSNETSSTVSGSWSVLPDFSSEQINKARQKKDTMVLYIQALLFTLSTSGVPSAIVMMVLLIALQTVLFIFALSFMLSYSRKSGWDKKNTTKSRGLLSSMKIISSTAFLPCLAVSAVSWYKPSFGISLGWMIYSFILGLRAVTIYLGRVKGRDTRAVV